MPKSEIEIKGALRPRVCRRLAESKHTLYRVTTKHQKVCSNRLHLYEKPTGCMTNVGLRLKKPAMTMTSTSHSSLNSLDSHRLWFQGSYRLCTAWMYNIKTWTGLSVDESIRKRTGINGQSMSMVWPTLGSRTAEEQNRTVFVLQCFLWFPDYEHFGFQGLHVANGGEDCSFHLTEGSVPIRTSGLVR